MRLLLIVFACGLFVLYFGFQEGRLALACGSTPREVSCLELASSGPGDNPYVIVTDFMFGGNVAIKTGIASNDWKESWIPMHSMADLMDIAISQNSESNPNAQPPFRVLLMSKSISGEDEAAHWQKVGRLEGMIVNGVFGLDSEARDLLASSYPGVDFSKVWILDHGHKPKPLILVLGMMLLGLVICGIAVYFFVAALRVKEKPAEAVEASPQQ